MKIFTCMHNLTLSYREITIETTSHACPYNCLKLFFFNNVTTISYEVQTPLELGVSRCPTFLWHLHDTCWTGVLNNCCFLYFNTPTVNVWHQYNTHTSRVWQLRQISKTISLLEVIMSIIEFSEWTACILTHPKYIKLMKA